MLQFLLMNQQLYLLVLLKILEEYTLMELFIRAQNVMFKHCLLHLIIEIVQYVLFIYTIRLEEPS